jgi:transposase-like protein
VTLEDLTLTMSDIAELAGVERAVVTTWRKRAERRSGFQPRTPLTAKAAARGAVTALVRPAAPGW